MPTEYDVIVVGGGPAGSSTAGFLARAGRKVLLLDRQKFPREKICGDGISGRSVQILKELGAYEKFPKAEIQGMFGITFSSPDGTAVLVDSHKPKDQDPPGFVCRREVFDNVLFQHAKNCGAEVIEGFNASGLVMEGTRVCGVKGSKNGKEAEYRARVVVGADGAGGMTSRSLGTHNDSPDHQFAGVRCYYENVGEMIDQTELHFVKKAIPGYFWIFPLPGNRANVGLCILVSDMKKKKINLQKLMSDIIQNHPKFRSRFRNARQITPVKSWILPLGSRRMDIAGDGYVLVGDAASLIDPFTGEGIGNSLTSGKYASLAVIEALEKNDFSKKMLSRYRKELFAVIQGELKTSHRMQRLANHAFMLNLMIGKAHRSKRIQAALSDALMNPDHHQKIIDPMFILSVLFE